MRVGWNGNGCKYSYKEQGKLSQIRKHGIDIVNLYTISVKSICDFG